MRVAYQMASGQSIMRTVTQNKKLIGKEESSMEHGLSGTQMNRKELKVKYKAGLQLGNGLNGIQMGPRALKVQEKDRLKKRNGQFGMIKFKQISVLMSKYFMCQY